jgi:hypothetical protein
MAQPRCGTDEPEHGGPLTNPEVVEAPWPTEHTTIEQVKRKETRQITALKLLVTKARVQELHPELTGSALRDRWQQMRRAVLDVGYAQRVLRYGAPGRHPCGAGPENTNKPEYALAVFWKAHKPAWFSDAWVPEKFWD